MTTRSARAWDNGGVNAVPEAVALRHIIVVGGTLAEWAAMTDEQWSERLDELGKVADHVGASWLSLRPYRGAGDGAEVPERSLAVGHCWVDAQANPDGRSRIAVAVAELRASGEAVSEDAIARRLNAPAEADPDLVVILGSRHQLPPSLVWELAYSELVFLDLDWSHLGARHLDDAIGTYARRNRRFGGVDD